MFPAPLVERLLQSPETRARTEPLELAQLVALVEQQPPSCLALERVETEVIRHPTRALLAPLAESSSTGNELQIQILTANRASQWRTGHAFAPRRRRVWILALASEHGSGSDEQALPS